MHCVYLTTYFGNKMPMFYIGSSTKKRIDNGYRGSVKSKKYSAIWKEELKNNPQLFKTKIVSFHNSDITSRNKEYKLQKQLNVVHSDLYINLSYAAKNGYFGRKISRSDSPNYGKKLSTDICKKISDAKKGKKLNHKRTVSDYYKKQMSIRRIGVKLSEKTKEKMKCAHKGKPGRKWTDEERKSFGEKQIGTKRSKESIKKQIETRIKNGKRLTEESKKILSEKNKNNSRKTIQFILKHESGKIVECYNTVHAAEITNLHKSSVYRLKIGKINKHKGWTICYT